MTTCMLSIQTSSKRHVFFDNLDDATYHMIMIAFGVPIKYFMEMHFCIVEVKHSYKEL